MLKDDFIKSIAEIGQCEDEAERREMLATLQEEAVKDYDKIDTLTSDNEALKEEREKLRDYNMKLFLRVGEQKDPDKVKENETGMKADETKKKSFDDLFDEKGAIK